MKSWKKRLNEEFDKAAPALKQDVLDAPIVVDRSVKATDSKRSPIRRGGWFACGTAVAIAAIFVMLGVLGVFNSSPKADKYVFALDINPSVSFITDADGIVLDVKALNADADVIVSNQKILDKIKDRPLAEAIVAYADYAVQLGYIPLDAQSAVRLSASDETDDKLFQNVSSGLSDYFKKKGIYVAVAEEKVATTEFAQRLGVETTSLSELSSTLETVSPIFAERNVSAEMTREDFEKLYDDYIICDQLLEYVKSELVKKLGDIKAFLTQIYLLGQIHLYNGLIMTNIHNPEWSWFIGADYWTIKDGSYTDLDSDFAELISTMEELVIKYEEQFGKLEDYSLFKSLYNSMEALIDSLSSIYSVKLEDLSLGEIEESFENYVEILSCVGVDVSNLKKLTTVPESKEDYIDQLHVSWEQVVKDRLDSNKSAYEECRTEISADEYDAFIADVEANYGSLENFWKNNQKISK